MAQAKTWEQYLPSIKSIADAKDYIIKGHGEWSGNTTKLRLICRIHGEWNSTSIADFLRGKACPGCGRETNGKKSLISDDKHIEEFMATGKFKKGTIFKRNLTKVNYRGHIGYWDYTCPICSHDEYVKAGVCTGIFTGDAGHLKAGCLSCRCSPAYRFTREQWEYRIKKECKLRGYVFLGWSGDRWGCSYKFTYNCPTHDEHRIVSDDFFAGQGCPLCAGRSQQECYINVVKDGDLPVALKLGISKNSDIRLKIQNSRNKLNMERIALYSFPTVAQCKAAERCCKKTLRRKVVSKQDMPDGWTETVALTDYDKVVSIYERFGGVRVDTTTVHALEQEEEMV